MRHRSIFGSAALVLALAVAPMASATTGGQRIVMFAKKIKARAAFILPAAGSVYYTDFGDSRVQFSQSAPVNGTVYSLTEVLGNGMFTLLNAATPGLGYRASAGGAGVGSQTQAGGYFRTDNASTVNTGNPAYTSGVSGYTNDLADAYYNIFGTGGDHTHNVAPNTAAGAGITLPEAGNMVRYLMGINDAGFTGGNTAATVMGCHLSNCYTGSDAKYSIQVNSAALTKLTANGKGVFLFNSSPRGYSLSMMEAVTCVSCSTFTVANTSGWVDGQAFAVGGTGYPSPPVISDANVIYIKVANVGACTAGNQYYAATGAYTFCAGATKPASKAYATYAYTPIGDAPLNSPQYDLHLAQSTAAQLSADAGNTYTGNGLLSLPGVYGVDTWTILDTGDANHDATAGVNADGTHFSIWGQVVEAAGAYRPRMLALFPSMSDTPQGAPLGGTFTPCEGYTGGSNLKIFSSATQCYSPYSTEALYSPPAMPSDMLGTICQNAMNGGYMGLLMWNSTTSLVTKIATASMVTSTTGTFTGVLLDNTVGSNNTFDCTSGAWKITFLATFPLRNLLMISEDANNLINNPYFDGQPSSTGTLYGTPPCTAGVNCGFTGNLPYSYAFSASGGVSTGLAPGGTPTLNMALTTVATPVPYGTGTVNCLQFAMTGYVATAGSFQIVQGAAQKLDVTRFPANAQARLYATQGFTPISGQVYGMAPGGTSATASVTAAQSNYANGPAGTTSISMSNGAAAQVQPWLDTSTTAYWSAKMPANLSFGNTGFAQIQHTLPADLTGVTPTTGSMTSAINIKAGPVNGNALLCPNALEAVIY